MPEAFNRSQRLDRAIADLLAQAPEVEAAAVVSFDGLPMASALPATMDEDRVAAMSAALLSLGERAAEGLGRGGLNQVYIEGESGTVFLVSAEDEAVLVAVAAKGAKVGMMLYEVRRAADSVATALRIDEAEAEAEAEADAAPIAEYEAAVAAAPALEAPVSEAPVAPATVVEGVAEPVEPAVAEAPYLQAVATPAEEVAPEVTPAPVYAASTSDSGWVSHLPHTTSVQTDPPSWS